MVIIIFEEKKKSLNLRGKTAVTYEIQRQLWATRQPGAPSRMLACWKKVSKITIAGTLWQEGVCVLLELQQTPDTSLPSILHLLTNSYSPAMPHSWNALSSRKAAQSASLFLSSHLMTFIVPPI